MTQNYINHIALVLDASGSMQPFARDLIRVADRQIAHLAQRSKEMDQETRITVYVFEDRGRISCLFYDKDVLRMPSIASGYAPKGQTPLIDATIKALDDLEKTATLYGDHAFLVYVLTDGAENASVAKDYDLSGRLRRLPENWTVACFVPNAAGVFEAKKFGFAADNVAVWSVGTDGLHEVGETLRRTTDAYMNARRSGVRGTRTLFTLDPNRLTTRAVESLDGLTPSQFRMFTIEQRDCNTKMSTAGNQRAVEIAAFVEKQLGRPYQVGEALYELTKPEVVQASKLVAIHDRRTQKVYTGAGARKLLGLPDHEIRLRPNDHPNYAVFIQSNSVNRKLLSGQRVLVLS